MWYKVEQKTYIFLSYFKVIQTKLFHIFLLWQNVFDFLYFCEHRMYFLSNNLEEGKSFYWYFTLIYSWYVFVMMVKTENNIMQSESSL